MEIRKDDTERAINLLKFYKSKLNKSEDKSLRKAMDKLVETLEAPLFSALLDIQEFYEVSLTTAIYGNQLKSPEVVEESDQQRSFAMQQESSVKVKKERSKKTRKSQRSDDEEVQNKISKEIPTKVNQEPASPKNSNQDHIDSKQYKQVQEEVHEEQIDDDSQNPWLYFEIELMKGRKGYGFAVAGGYNKPHYEGDNGIFVTKIIPEGAAEVDGRLRIDDVIVTVNDVNLEHVTHEMAVETLKNAGQSMILLIRRLKEEFFENAQFTAEQSAPDQFDPAYFPSEQDAYHEEHVENFQQFEVTLVKRAGGGLGISIQGGYDPNNHEEDSYIYISKLTPNGVAANDGRLEVGDIILHVDDQSLNGLTHEEAVNLLKNTGKQVILYIGRFVENIQEVEQDPEEHIVEKTEKKKKKKHRRDRDE